MPRNYKRKEGAKKRVSRDEQNLKEAVNAVINDAASLKSTAKRFELNVMTLKRYVSNKKQMKIQYRSHQTTRKRKYLRLEKRDHLLFIYTKPVSFIMG